MNEASVESTVLASALDLAAFTGLLQQEFRPRTDQAKEAIVLAVKALATQAMATSPQTSRGTVDTIEAMIAEIDRKLTLQLNHILHDPRFQALESAWRGLHYLICNTETSERQKVRFLNASKPEIARELRKYKGVAWDQSPLFKMIYEREFGQLGGEPYGVLIADFYFDHSSPDVELLRAMARIASAAHVPLITGAAPSVMLMESWQELANPRELAKLFQTPEHAGWRDFRESEDARYIGLAMPRFLARVPYGARTAPVDDFAFEEATGVDAGTYLWANAAYVMGVNINRSFSLYGWCSQIRGIESGGAVNGLPVYTFPTDDGGVDMTCPTEIAISDRREFELAKCGFMPLVHRKNTSLAAFIGAQSLHRPQEYDAPEATANAALAARLPYLFATCRFAHYLKCIVRDKIGSFSERADMEVWLNNWVGRYVELNPATATDADKARKPLAGANVIVEEDHARPGFYLAKFFLRPHYQLEGLTVSLRLVSRLPQVQA